MPTAGSVDAWQAPPGGVAADRPRVVLVRLATWLERAAAHPENVMAPLKLGWAAALLEQQGCAFRLIDTELGGWDPGRLAREIEADRPDLIVVDGTSTSVPLMLELSGRWRERLPDSLLLAVGQHATILPGTLLGPGGYHACALQEYEEIVADVAAGLGGDLAQIPGLALPGGGDGGGDVLRTAERPLRDDLDALPLPLHRLFRDARNRVYHPTGVARRIRWGFSMSTRGCPYPCVYCSGTLRNSSGRAYRKRSPEGVAAEVRLLHSLGFTVMHFKDDIFTLDRDHTLALCEALALQGALVPFTVQTRVDRVDPEIFQALKAAGCRTVSFGVESGSQVIVDRLKKNATVDQARDAFRHAREAGLLRVGFFLLGNPGETREDMEATLALAHELDPDILQCGFLTPYPGAGTWKELPEDERPTDFANLSHYNQAWNPSAVPTDELLAFQKRFYRELVGNPRFMLRYAKIRRWELLLNPERELPFAREAVKFLLNQRRAPAAQ